MLSSRVILVTADLTRLREFYERVIGLHPYREYGIDGEVSGVVLFLGGGFLELVQDRDEHLHPPPSPAVKLWLQVADLAAEERRLTAAGADIRKPRGRMPWGLDEMWLVDPDGWELRVIEVPPEHPLRRRL